MNASIQRGHPNKKPASTCGENGFCCWCGGRGIRTPGPRERTTVFKTAAFDHSAIPPGAKLVKFWIGDQKMGQLKSIPLNTGVADYL
jgi:hypothetical protein